jgi:hypothetical protein
LVRWGFVGFLAFWLDREACWLNGDLFVDYGGAMCWQKVATMLLCLLLSLKKARFCSQFLYDLICAKYGLDPDPDLDREPEPEPKLFRCQSGNRILNK